MDFSAIEKRIFPSPPIYCDLNIKALKLFYLFNRFSECFNRHRFSLIIKVRWVLQFCKAPITTLQPKGWCQNAIKIRYYLNEKCWNFHELKSHLVVRFLRTHLGNQNFEFSLMYLFLTWETYSILCVISKAANILGLYVGIFNKKNSNINLDYFSSFVFDPRMIWGCSSVGFDLFTNFPRLIDLDDLGLSFEEPQCLNLSNPMTRRPKRLNNWIFNLEPSVGVSRYDGLDSDWLSATRPGSTDPPRRLRVTSSGTTDPPRRLRARSSGTLDPRRRLPVTVSSCWLSRMISTLINLGVWKVKISTNFQKIQQGLKLTINQRKISIKY